MKDKTQSREELADYAHKAWSGWMQYLFESCREGDEAMANGTPEMIIPPALVARWKRQISTKYRDLPEAEKESDRKEADEILTILLDNKEVSGGRSTSAGLAGYPNTDKETL